MPVDSGGRPPKATDGQPPPPDSSRKGPGDQHRSTDNPPSTSRAGQSSKQSNFDKYLANTRQGSDQPREGDDGTKVGKAGSAGTDKAGRTIGDAGGAHANDNGKGQPGGTAPAGDAPGAKPQGDSSSGGGAKPEGQSSNGTKPEGQSGDAGKQQGSSGGGDSKGAPERAYPGSKNAPDHEPYTVRGNPEKMIVENTNARQNWNRAAAEVLERRYKKGSFQANLKDFEDHLHRLPDGPQKIGKRWNLASKQGLARYISSLVQQKFYRNEAKRPTWHYTPAQIEKMKRGIAPDPKQQVEHISDLARRPTGSIKPENVYLTEGGKKGGLPKGSPHYEKTHGEVGQKLERIEAKIAQRAPGGQPVDPTPRKPEGGQPRAPQSAPGVPGKGKATAGPTPASPNPPTPPRQGASGALGKAGRPAGAAGKLGTGLGRAATGAAKAAGPLNWALDIFRHLRLEYPEKLLREGQKLELYRTDPKNPLYRIPSGYTIEKTGGKVIYRDSTGKIVPKSATEFHPFGKDWA